MRRWMWAASAALMANLWAAPVSSFGGDIMGVKTPGIQAQVLKLQQAN